MFIDLITERLLLRCICYDDAAFFYQQFSNDDVNRYLYDAEALEKIIGFARETMQVNKIYAHISADNELIRTMKNFTARNICITSMRNHCNTHI